ncbi:MAG: Holliday junction resolvase RuvX [Armatimonadota bacterium]
MGLDVGDKTVGVAVSDELGITAHPVMVIRRTGSIKKESAEILRLAQEYNVERIVVGRPLMMDGTAGVQAEKEGFFVEALRRRTHIPIVEWDERLSTSEAERMLIEADQSRSKRREIIDKVAAAVILDSYMRSQSGIKSIQDEDSHSDD